MVTAGQIILSLPLAFSAVQCIKLIGERGRGVDSKGIRFDISNSQLAKLTFAGVLAAFLFLVYKFVISDFSYALVFQHSNTMKPMMYKVSGVWGNHEGSMMLFLTILTGYGYLFTKISRFEFKEDALAYQGMINFLLLFYIFFTSNPFDAIPAEQGVPEQGMGLNPLLQDVGLAMHPPVLYVGFAGFSLAFSIALTVLKRNITQKNWCEYSRPWIIISYIFLSCGVGLGSWWAYRELGWGGFWFWDPVENTSLLPWLFGCALIHSMYCTKKFNRFAMLTILLSLLTFMTALLGFFLVRSGVLSSVHSFASDPTRGSVMLFITFIIFSVAMISFGKKYTEMKFVTEDQIFAVSREVAILVQIVLLLAMAATILLGIFYPIILDLLFEKKMAVGEPYFNAVFVPISLVMSALMIFIPVMKWQRERLFIVIKKSLLSLFISMCITIFMEAKYEDKINLTMSFAIFIFSWLIILAVDVVIRKLLTKDKISKGFISMIISHAAFGLLGLSITLNMAFSDDTQVAFKLKDKNEFMGNDIELVSSEIIKGKNYLGQTARFKVNGGYLSPENRIYFPDLTKTYEVDVDYGMFKDVYLVMGQTEQSAEGKEKQESAYVFPVRIYVKYFMFFIWFSLVAMAFGGFIALLPKKK